MSLISIESDQELYKLFCKINYKIMLGIEIKEKLDFLRCKALRENRKDLTNSFLKVEWDNIYYSNIDEDEKTELLKQLVYKYI